MANKDFFDDVSLETIEALSNMPPVIQFHNGDPRETKGTIAHSGGWFLPEDQASVRSPR